MTDDLDRVAEFIRETPTVVLTAKRRERMRRRILDQVGDPRSAYPPRPGRAGLALGIGLSAAAALALVGALGWSSLPGDPAFPLKVGVEETGIALSANTYERLERATSYADRRLDDLAAVAGGERGRLSAAARAYGRGLDELGAAIDAMLASDHPDRDRALDQARRALEDQMKRLMAIGRAGEGEVERVREQARDIEDRVRQVPGEGVPVDGQPTANPSRGSPDTPAGAPDGTARPSPTRTPEPAKTAAPTVTPARTPDPSRTPEPTRTPDPSKTPHPAETPTASGSAHP